MIVVDSMNKATKHLLGNLTEQEKYEAERMAYESLQNKHIDHKQLKDKVMKLGENAIKGNIIHLILCTCTVLVFIQ